MVAGERIELLLYRWIHLFLSPFLYALRFYRQFAVGSMYIRLTAHCLLLTVHFLYRKGYWGAL